MAIGRGHSSHLEPSRRRDGHVFILHRPGGMDHGPGCCRRRWLPSHPVPLYPSAEPERESSRPHPGPSCFSRPLDGAVTGPAHRNMQTLPAIRTCSQECDYRDKHHPPASHLLSRGLWSSSAQRRANFPLIQLRYGPTLFPSLFPPLCPGLPPPSPPSLNIPELDPGSSPQSYGLVQPSSHLSELLDPLAPALPSAPLCPWKLS